MTREEASFYLANMDRKYMEKNMSEALDMAIKALEQEPCDVINAVIEWLKEKDFIKMSWQEENARKELQEYFSVTPSRRKGHWRAVYQGDEIINYRCSECELGDTNGSTNLYGWDYCRRCGAEMESDK